MNKLFNNIKENLSGLSLILMFTGFFCYVFAMIDLTLGEWKTEKNELRISKDGEGNPVFFIPQKDGSYEIRGLPLGKTKAFQVYSISFLGSFIDGAKTNSKIIFE